MEPKDQNLDVWQMQAELEAQAQADAEDRQQQVAAGYGSYSYADAQAKTYVGAGYGNYESDVTRARSSYGDIPGMMATGISYAGSAVAGAYRGATNMLSAVGTAIRPPNYVPPARVYTGQYGQYRQETGLISGALGLMGLNSAHPGTNSYQHGYYNAMDLGERVGSFGVSAATLLGGMSIGAPIGTFLGKGVGSVLGSSLGPIGSFAGGAAGALFGGLAGYMAVDALAESVAQRREIDSFLQSSSFRYVGSGNDMYDSRIGGMNAGARRQVTDLMRAMDIRDPSMGTEDLFKVMQDATRLGMFTGTNDIESFKKRYKDIVEGVKSVTRVLGTSLEEGMQVMKDLRAINIDPSVMRQTVMQADVIGRATGRTGMEVVGLGMQGAELFRGTGIEMKIGYQANVMNLASIRAARDAGTLSQEAIVQAGGEEALAQRMTASSLGFMQSATGRGYGAAYFHQGMGATGFDAGAFRQDVLGGGASMFDLANRMAQNLSDPSKWMSYQANQAKFMSEMGKTFGGQGGQMGLINSAMSVAQMYKQADPNINIQDAFRVALQEMGQSEAEIDTLLGMIKNAGKDFKGKTKALETTRSQQMISNIMETRGFGYLFGRAEDEIKRAFEPIVSGGSAFIGAVQQDLINIWEEKGLGIYRANVSDANYAAFRAPQYKPKPLTPDQLAVLEYGKDIKSLAESGVAPDAKSNIPAPGDVPAETRREMLEKAWRANLTERSDLQNKYGVFSDTVNLDKGMHPLTKGITAGGIALGVGLAAGFALTGPLSIPLAVAGGIAAGVGSGLTLGQTFSFTPTIGQQIVENADQLVMFGMDAPKIKDRSKVAPGEVIVEEMGDKVKVVREERLNKSLQAQQSLFMTSEQAQKMEDEGRIDKTTIDDKIKMLRAMSRSTPDQIAKAKYGTDITTLAKQKVYDPENPATKGLPVVRTASGGYAPTGMYPTLAEAEKAVRTEMVYSSREEETLTLQSVVRKFFGKEVDKMTEADWARFIRIAEELAKDGAPEIKAIIEEARDIARKLADVEHAARIDEIKKAQGKIDDVGGKLFQGTAFEGPLNRKSSLLLTQAQKLDKASPEYKQDLDRILYQAYTAQKQDPLSGKAWQGSSFESWSEATKTLLNDPSKSAMFSTLAANANIVDKNTEAAGFSALVSSLRQDIVDNRIPGMKSSAPLLATLDKLASPGGLLAFKELNKDDVLFQSTIGPKLLAAKDAITRLDDLSRTDEYEKANNLERQALVKKAVSETGLKDAADTVVEAWKNQGGIQGAQTAALAEGMGQRNPATLTATPGTSQPGTGVGQGDTNAINTIQYNMFQDVKTALEGVARRLGV